MKNAADHHVLPMRIQARKGSPAENLYYMKSILPGYAWPMPKAIAPGIDPAPLEDLIFHGGKIVPQMQFQNIYLGHASQWKAGVTDSIDQAITLAMRDKRLNNVMKQYFHGAALACDPIHSMMLDKASHQRLHEADIKSQVIALHDAGKLPGGDLGATIFNLILPPSVVLALDDITSLNGLGGYHGSVRIERGGKEITLYYSANVYSEILSNGHENGISAFDEPWKNVVATLYHELNEFRTDADVNDAIERRDNDFLGWTSRSGRECGDQPIFAANSLDLVFKEVESGSDKVPVQFMYSNVVHGAEGPLDAPHSSQKP